MALYTEMGDFDFDFELDATDLGPRVAWFIVLWMMPKADSGSFGIRIAFLLDSIAMQEKLPHLVSLLLSPVRVTGGER